MVTPELDKWKALPTLFDLNKNKYYQGNSRPRIAQIIYMLLVNFLNLTMQCTCINRKTHGGIKDSVQHEVMALNHTVT